MITAGWSVGPLACPAFVARDVHVWMIDLDAPDAGGGAVLDAHERSRASGFRFPLDRERYVAAHGALRAILGAYLGIGARDVAFDRREAGGKPRLAGGGPCFNLAHSEGVGLVAVADREVGVDIERMRMDAADFTIAERFFSAAEVAALRERPGAARAQEFFRVWTAKEAYVKACGAGLALDLRAFTVALAGDDATLCAGDDARVLVDWWLTPLPAGPVYAAALAVAAPRSPIRSWRWRPRVLRATA